MLFWETQHPSNLSVTEILNSLGVELVSPNANKHEMAQCDLWNYRSRLSSP